jgi:hypothetical protein
MAKRAAASRKAAEHRPEARSPLHEAAPAPPGEQRRYPRYTETLPVRIFRQRSKANQHLDFSASVHTHEISMGGLYLESTFFLKTGLQLELEISLPNPKHKVRVSGEIAYALDEGAAARARKPSGFALRFTRFHGDSQVYLWIFLARGDPHGFAAAYAKKRLPRLPESDYEALVELIAHWEILQLALRDSAAPST